jgi:hypothetical protein
MTAVERSLRAYFNLYEEAIFISDLLLSLSVDNNEMKLSVTFW